MATKMKFLYIVLGAVVGFAGGYLVARETAPQPAASWTFGLELEGRPLKGAEDARVTIVEFTDYECGFCKRYNETTYPILLSQYGDRISYTVRHFPVSYLHKRAHRAAQGAECAGDQDSFFEYHDMLFRNMLSLDDESLVDYAVQLGLDTDQFNACLDSDQFAAEVQADVAEGEAAGVNSTPSFFINGRPLSGALPFSEFQRVIQGQSR